MRRQFENSCLLERFSGTLNQGKSRATEEFQMGPHRLNSHLHLSPMGCVLPFIPAHLLTVKINFHRLTVFLLSGNITMLFATEFHFKFPTRLDIACIYLKQMGKRIMRLF